MRRSAKSPPRMPPTLTRDRLEVRISWRECPSTGRTAENPFFVASGILPLVRAWSFNRWSPTRCVLLP